MQQQNGFKPFNEMVAALFNSTSFNTSAAGIGIMHAAFGISGEATELVFSDGLTNFVEEAGDLEFYVEALYQQAGLSDLSLVIADNRHCDTASEEGDFSLILQAAGNILDYAKKHWVYSKPLDHNLKTLMAVEVGRMQGALLRLYSYYESDRERIINYNQTKLAKRYPGGVYTDTHAQARLDKQEG